MILIQLKISTLLRGGRQEVHIRKGFRADYLLTSHIFVGHRKSLQICVCVFVPASLILHTLLTTVLFLTTS